MSSEEPALADRIAQLSKSGRLPAPFGVADIRQHFGCEYEESHIRTVLPNYCEGGDMVKRGHRPRFKRQSRGRYRAI